MPIVCAIQYSGRPIVVYSDNVFVVRIWVDSSIWKIF